MLAASRRTYSRSPMAPAWSEAVIRLALGADTWRLDNGRQARQAVSCLVTPAPGDRVLIATLADGADYVLHVLARDNRGDATLSVPGADRLSIRQSHVDVSASETIALRAADDIELTSVRGSLSLNARNVFASATESLVHTARSYVGQVEQFLLNARQLLRLHGEQAIITARQDAKIDAERISLG
jgi:Protein of unknown function (DUF3540)